MDFQTSLECVICKEEYNRTSHAPLVLLCGHSVCQHCAQVLRETEGRLYCPLDRKPDPRRSDQIPVSLQIIELMEFASKMRTKIDYMRLGPEEQKTAARKALERDKETCVQLLGKIETKIASVEQIKKKALEDVRESFSGVETELRNRQVALEADLDRLANEEITRYRGFIEEIELRTENLEQNCEHLRRSEPAVSIEVPTVSDEIRLICNGKKAAEMLETLGKLTCGSVKFPYECDHFQNVTYWMVPPCCASFYCCNKCHDSKENHPWQYATKMVCMVCSREQVYRKLPNYCDYCAFAHKTVVSKLAIASR